MVITIKSADLHERTRKALGLSWGDHGFNLAAFDEKARAKLREALDIDAKNPAHLRLRKNLNTYEASLKLVGDENAPIKARSIPAAINAMRRFLRSLPSRRVYERDGELWCGVLITEIEHVKAVTNRDFCMRYKPAHRLDTKPAPFIGGNK